MARKRESKRAARERRSRAARKGWKTRRTKALARSRAAKAGWKTREANARLKAARRESQRRKREEKKRGAIDQYLTRGPILKLSPNVPRSRLRGPRSRQPGESLPKGDNFEAVERAYELRSELVSQGVEADRIRVFWIENGDEPANERARRRFTVEAFDRFLNDESYEPVLELLLEDGEFWLALQDEQGNAGILVERLL